MPLQPKGFSTGLLEQVLARLGLSDRPEPTLDGLRTLYAAWSRKVPFDNVRKLIHLHSRAPGPLPGDSPAQFLADWLAYGTGGTCWAGNGALQAVLTALGFDASRGIATMLVAPRALPNHGTVVVACEGTRHVVDASILHGAPLPLDASAPTDVAHPAWGVQCRRRDGTWHIHWRPLHKPDGLECRLEQLQATPESFCERHEATRGWSPFNYELYARSNRGDAVVGVARGQRVVFDGACVHQTALGADERQRVLIDELGMREEIVQRLPPDTPTPPPP
ncbi:MAG: arylamine N-acetyltransferase [Nevskia sp.]|nr:arylamine N-acetyltransferase [Nevskia sp.]